MSDNNWFGNIVTIVKSKPEVRNTFLMVFIILYFGFRDYKQAESNKAISKAWQEVAEFQKLRADKYETKYDKRVDLDISKAEAKTDSNDTLLVYLKRLKHDK